jgi:Gram-negative bacterial TonB protein C-terminal
MLRFWLALTAALLAAETLFAAEVQTKSTATPAPSKPAASPSATVAPAQLPQYRPALLGTGPTSVINRIDTAGLIRDGQKDGQLYFRCSVGKTGEIMDTWTYSQSPDSTLLERELVRCLDQAVFIPAVYDHEPVNVFFFGTITFKIVDGKPRLRIFANQEPEELKKESDFIGPQPFVGRGSKFEGLHYPNDAVTSELTGLVELGMKIDATGKLLDLRVVSEYPPLVGFRRAAAEDFRVASFIPAFRDGKPVECNVTLPVYYEP